MLLNMIISPKPDTAHHTELEQRPYALVVDDHPLAGRGMAEYLKSNPRIAQVVNAHTAPAALQAMSTHGAALLAVVDFWLTDGSTLELVSQLRRASAATAVLIMSGDDDPAVEAAALKCGAHGFVHKQQPPEVFGNAVDAVLNGATWFQARPSTGAARPRELPVTPHDLGLSARQGQILWLILQGMPNKRIALNLSVSESTVKEHVTGILQKLEVNNRVEAITKLRGRKLVLNHHA